MVLLDSFLSLPGTGKVWLHGVAGFLPVTAGNREGLAAWCCWIPSCHCREQGRSGCMVLLDSFLSLPGTGKVWLHGVAGFLPVTAGNREGLAAWCCWIPSCHCREQGRSGCMVLLDSFLSLPGTGKVWLHGVAGFLPVTAGNREGLAAWCCWIPSCHCREQGRSGCMVLLDSFLSLPGTGKVWLHGVAGFLPVTAGNREGLAAWCCWIPSCHCREQGRSGCMVLLDSFLSLPGTGKVWLHGVAGFLPVTAGNREGLAAWCCWIPSCHCREQGRSGCMVLLDSFLSLPGTGKVWLHGVAGFLPVTAGNREGLAAWCCWIPSCHCREQ